MKKHIRVMALGASLMLTGAAFAQDVPPPAPVPPPPASEATPPPPPGQVPPPPPAGDALPPPPPDPSMPAPASASPPPPPTGDAGQVSVNSAPPPAKPSGPAPDFATLSGGKGSITEKQASAFPLLANDFQYADTNHDKRISKSEYQKWVTKSGASGQ